MTFYTGIYRMRRYLLLFLLTLLIAGLAPSEAQKIDPLTGKVTEQAPEPEPEAPVAADLTKANELVRKQKYAEAETLLAELQLEFPEDDRLLTMRGELLVALGKPKEAIPILTKVTELAPERDRVRFQLGSALASTGDPEAALEAFGGELDVSKDPQVRILSHLNRSALFQQKRAWSDAAAELTSALELDPSQKRGWTDLSSLRLEADDLEGAVAALEKAASFGYESVSHYYSVGARFFKEESYDRAISYFEKVLEIDKNHSRAVRSMAASLEESGNSSASIAQWKRYLELAPDADDADSVRQRIAALSK